MGTGKVSVEEGALPRAARIVAQAKIDLDKELKTLEGKIGSIHWSSGAATAFYGLMEQWKGDQRKILGALDVFERNLLDSDSTYQSSDQDAKQWLTKHAAGLGG